MPGGTIGAVDLVGSSDAHTIRDITVETGDSADWPRLTEAVNRVPGARVLDATDRTFMLHIGGKIEVSNKSPLKTRDDLSMAYTPGVARVCDAIHRGSRQGLPVHDQAQYGGGRLRRHGGPRARGHRPAGGDAGDGGQGDAVQGVRRRRCVPDLPGHARPRGDRRRRSRRSRPGFGGHQPRGHLGAALLRDRGPAAGRARHPRVPRRPARDRGRGAGGAAQRADLDRPADRRYPGRHRGPRRGGDRGRQDPDGGRRAPHHRL